MEISEYTELLPGLPEEVGLDCLYRLPYTTHRVASGVCRRWQQLIQSPHFYHHRKTSGYTRKVACLVQALNSGISGGRKSRGLPSYGITVFDSTGQTWERLDPIPKYPNGLPLFCQLASCEGKLVAMGGWDPVTYNPVNDVFVYDFTTQQWRLVKDMPSKRTFFAVGAYSGRVYVAGGHDENKNALRSGWVYDLRSDEWTELGEMSQERDECEGVVIGDEFWVVSGYTTEKQGEFDGSADVYKIGSGQWRRVEGVCKEGRCPRSRVGVGKDGKLLSWDELEAGIQVGTCGVMLDQGRTLVSGSEYEGGPNGFYIVETKEGQEKYKLERMNVGDEEFCGFVQSGCCAEI